MKLESRGAGIICRQSPAYRQGSAAAVAMTFTADHVAGLIQEVRSGGCSPVSKCVARQGKAGVCLCVQPRLLTVSKHMRHISSSHACVHT